ncbi:PD-(D/E)XK nuclease family protein [Yeosuana marina]|uniref:PDDEXK-like family protein n=1 Tax=Yeosuana marina TaxID=1565536 RepID=UPI0030C82CEC
MVEKQNVQKLCKNVKRIVKHHNELAKLKGEHFNVFSILNMESKENGTHSAFLGELLNPRGTHYLGSTFLELFLQVVKQNNMPFNTSKASLKLEHPIGNRNDAKKTGGRIDIYIKDNTGNTICIENKIYAQDQNVQIERYNNHNIGKNTVYYLTLFGEEPSEASKGNLISGIDFYCISYHKHIKEWLELCLKEAHGYPILRESINQYLILIKKLTNTLNTEQEKELTDLLLNELETSFTIVQNLYKVKEALKDEFYEQLKELGKEFNMTSPEYNVLVPSNWNDNKICFSYEAGGVLIGVKRNKEDQNKTRFSELEDAFPENFRTSAWWPMYRDFYSGIDNNSNFWLDIKSGKAKEKAKLFIETINNNFNNTKY